MTGTATKILKLNPLNSKEQDSSKEFIVFSTLKRLIGALGGADKLNQTKKILTDKDKHHMLHLALSGDEENFYNLTSAEKLRILDELFRGEEERLTGLTNAKKLSLLEELFTGKKERVPLTDTEKDDILLTLFGQKEGELDSSFLFKGKGAELYDKISKDEEYPFMKIEMDFLSRLISHPKFKKKLEKTKTVCDNGAGNGDKALALFMNSYWEGTYIPEDFSREMLDIAERKIKDAIKRYPGMHGMKIGNPQKLNSNKHLTSSLKNNMYLFLGGTICNMSDKEIVDVLKNMDNKGTLKGNTILISYYTAPKTEEEIQKLISIYHSENNRIFHEYWMKMLGLSKDEFEFITVYKKDDENQKIGPFTGRIEGRIRAKKDAIIKLNNGRTIEVKAGQEFILHYSTRFSDEKIKSLFKEGGCSINHTITENKNGIISRDGVCMALLEREPTKRKSVIRGVRNSIISAILGATVATCAHYYQDYKTHNEKKDYTTQWERKRSISDQDGVNYALESQESKEFLTAIGLDEADNEVKKAINFNYNSYVQDHKGDSLSREELISRYRDEYGGTLINEYGAKSPYSFITKELIDNTYYASNNGVSDEEHFRAKEFKANGYEFFEFNDYGDEYIIIKACIGKERTPIYLAGKKGNSSIITFSTNSVENIMNKEELDKKILANNNNLKTNLLTRCRVHDDGKIDILNSGLYIIEDCINFEIFKTHTMYLKGKIYYVKKGKTESGYEVLGASESPDGPFSITMFNNEISKDFHEARYMRIPSNHKQRIKDRAYPSSHQMGVRPSTGN